MYVNLTKAAAAVCTTAACVQVARDFVSNLSPRYKALDPCADFDEFACAGFRTRVALRPDQPWLDSLDQMVERGDKILKDIMEGPYPGRQGQGDDVDRANFGKMQSAYRACMDVERIRAAGAEPLRALLRELGGTLGRDDLGEALVFLARLGAPGLGLSLSAEVSTLDRDKTVVMLAPAAPGLGAVEYYEDADVMGEYTAAVAAVFSGLPLAQGGNATQAAERVVRFERALARIYPPLGELDDPEKYNNYLTLQQASELIPQLHLAEVVQALAPAGYVPDALLVLSPAHLGNLSALLAAAPRETVGGYVVWSAIQALQASVVAPDIFGPYRRFLAALQGGDPDAETERWRTCIDHVDAGLGWILSRFFLEGRFSAEDRALGIGIIEDIKKVYADTFRGLAWMEDAVRKEALRKLELMDLKIGYPLEFPNVTDPASLQALYANVSITTSFFANDVSFRADTARQTFSVLGRPAEHKRWYMLAHRVNAYYSRNTNDMAFPAAMLQLNVFGGPGAALPPAVNYGAFGAVAGHEVSHAFDAEGRAYDARGAFRDWWSPATEQEYNARVACFVDQFDNMTVRAAPGSAPVRLSGRQTLNENVADAAGLAAAYAAWKRSGVDGGGKTNLPGLEAFSSDQLFFLAYANMFCSSYTPQGLERWVGMAPYAPDPARIRGAVANSAGFRDAWGCKVREPTCRLWT